MVNMKIVITFCCVFIQVRIGKITCCIVLFTITAEILARSLANFYRQYADRHMNLKFVRRVSEQERAI